MQALHFLRRNLPLLRLLQAICVSILFAARLAVAVEPAEATRQAQPIIGGQPATETRSWMAALIRRSSSSNLSIRQACGGSLIAPSWVLTAAHCVKELEIGTYQVLLGHQDLTQAAPVLHDVAEHIPHPFYQGGRAYDIALIRLATPSTNAPVALATAAMEVEARGTSVQVLGWGTTAWKNTAACTMHFLDSVTNQPDFPCKAWVYSPSTRSPALMKTDLTLQSYEECDRRFKANLDKLKVPYGADALFGETTTPEVLCAWDAQDDSTPCYGDSGGPLIRNVGGTERLFGIVSGGMLEDCALTDQIALFSRVAYFQSFITYSMNRDPELGHGRLCPGVLTPNISYTARADGNQDVRLSWQKDSTAEGYRVFYSPHKNVGGNVQTLELPRDRTDVSVVLAKGQRFYVAVQGHSARCDGPISSLKAVKVP